MMARLPGRQWSCSTADFLCSITEPSRVFLLLIYFALRPRNKSIGRRSPRLLQYAVSQLHFRPRRSSSEKWCLLAPLMFYTQPNAHSVDCISRFPALWSLSLSSLRHSKIFEFDTVGSLFSIYPKNNTADVKHREWPSKQKNLRWFIQREGCWREMFGRKKFDAGAMF